MQRDINTIPYVYAKVNEIVTDCLLLEKIRINYTRKMRINLLLPRMGKKITGTRLSPNTRYLVGAFSLNKPLVLPVVGKNTLVNKNLAVIIEMVWRPHH